MLFELSHEDRLKILHRLSEEAMNVTRLSKTLDLTTQESSRHLSRLGDVGLTKKSFEGLHHLTPYGELVLKQLEGLKFVSLHKDYFAIHSLSYLPKEFVFRIGELFNGIYVNEVVSSFYNIDKIIQEAEEYIWEITDQYLLSTIPLLKEALDRGVKVRDIEAKDMVVPPKMMEAWRADTSTPEGLDRARIAGLLEERFLERLDIYLWMSEKEVAVISFPLKDGRFDYLGFTSKDERFHKWCRDLFQHYWEGACNRGSIVEELYRLVKERPKAIYTLKRIAAGKEIVNREDVISELEGMRLIRQGKLTILGDILYNKLQK